MKRFLYLVLWGFILFLSIGKICANDKYFYIDDKSSYNNDESTYLLVTYPLELQKVDGETLSAAPNSRNSIGVVRLAPGKHILNFRYEWQVETSGGRKSYFSRQNSDMDVDLEKGKVYKFVAYKDEKQQLTFLILYQFPYQTTALDNTVSYQFMPKEFAIKVTTSTTKNAETTYKLNDITGIPYYDDESQHLAFLVTNTEPGLFFSEKNIYKFVYKGRPSEELGDIAKESVDVFDVKIEKPKIIRGDKFDFALTGFSKRKNKWFVLLNNNQIGPFEKIDSEINFQPSYNKIIFEAQKNDGLWYLYDGDVVSEGVNEFKELVYYHPGWKQYYNPDPQKKAFCFRKGDKYFVKYGDKISPPFNEFIKGFYFNPNTRAIIYVVKKDVPGLGLKATVVQDFKDGEYYNEIGSFFYFYANGTKFLYEARKQDKWFIVEDNVVVASFDKVGKYFKMFSDEFNDFACDAWKKDANGQLKKVMMVRGKESMLFDETVSISVYNNKHCAVVGKKDGKCYLIFDHLNSEGYDDVSEKRAILVDEDKKLYFRAKINGKWVTQNMNIE